MVVQWGARHGWGTYFFLFLAIWGGLNELASFFVFVSWAKCGAPADAGSIYEGRLRAVDGKEAAVKYLFIFFWLKKLRSVACPHAVGANKGSGAKFL